MKLAVMQPYFFPYLGYFQLVAAVDEFVFFDDVNYINKGWINRNTLLERDRPLPFTVPLRRASQNRPIHELGLADFPAWRRRFLKTLECLYRKARCFGPAFDLVSGLLARDDCGTIAELAAGSVRGVAAHLGLTTAFHHSSRLTYHGDNGQDKILDLCTRLGAATYVNPANGAHLYQWERFRRRGIELLFLEPGLVPYDQGGCRPFVPSLSIIDVLMFNTVAEVRGFLGRGRLRSPVEPGD